MVEGGGGRSEVEKKVSVRFITVLGGLSGKSIGALG